MRFFPPRSPDGPWVQGEGVGRRGSEDEQEEGAEDMHGLEEGVGERAAGRVARRSPRGAGTSCHAEPEGRRSAGDFSASAFPECFVL